METGILRAVRAFITGLAGPLITLYQHLDLVERLLRRDVASRTSGTFLGSLWLLLQPALQVLAFWFLLDYVLKVRGVGRVAFVDYFLIGMLPWLFIQETLSRNLMVLTEFSPLYQRTLFPIRILPWVPLLMAAMVMAPVYALVAGALAGLAGFAKAWMVVVLLAVWLLPFCYLVALIGLFFKESRQVFPFLLTMVMYVTPILYQPDNLPDRAKAWMVFNVMADIMALIQHAMYGLPLTVGNWVRPLVLWFLLMPPVWVLFRRAESQMREEL